MTLRRNLTLVLIAAVAISLFAATMPSPAAASDTGKIIAGAIIGGLIGAALSDHDRDRYYDRGPVYVPPGAYGPHWTPRYAPVPRGYYTPRYAPPPGYYGYGGYGYGYGPGCR